MEKTYQSSSSSSSSSSFWDNNAEFRVQSCWISNNPKWIAMSVPMTKNLQQVPKNLEAVRESPSPFPPPPPPPPPPPAPPPRIHKATIVEKWLDSCWWNKSLRHLSPLGWRPCLNDDSLATPRRRLPPPPSPVPPPLLDTHTHTDTLTHPDTHRRPIHSRFDSPFEQITRPLSVHTHMPTLISIF